MDVNNFEDVLEILFDEDDFLAVLAIVNARNNGDLGVHQRVLVDVEGWRLLDGSTFQQNFRMNRTTFTKLVNVVGNHLVHMNRMTRVRTPMDLCLLYAVWMLANADTFRSSSHHFGTSKGVLHFHYAYILEALRELAPIYIKWPNALERDDIKTEFERRYGFPGVVGCIDGTNINVTAPLEQPQRYIDRHHQFSIIAQAVCDHNVLYRDVFVGQPGSVGDARTFSRSPLSRNLCRGAEFIFPDEHLLGDGAYTLLNQVLIPYIDDGRLTHMQRTYNNTHARCRSTVERSFALLKGKFRRLKMLPVYSHEYCIDHIVASFVLHNFIILEGEQCPVCYS